MSKGVLKKLLAGQKNNRKYFFSSFKMLGEGSKVFMGIIL